jgi:potassium efflux system protein
MGFDIAHTLRLDGPDSQNVESASMFPFFVKEDVLVMPRRTRPQTPSIHSSRGVCCLGWLLSVVLGIGLVGPGSDGVVQAQEQPMAETAPMPTQPAAAQPVPMVEPVPMEPPPAAEASRPSVDEIEAKIKTLEALTEPTEEQKQIKSLYEQARSFLQQFTAAEEKTKRFQQLIRERPQMIEQLEKELSKVPPPVSIPENGTLEQLEERLTAAQAELALARQEMQAEQTRPAEEAARLTELPGAIRKARDRLDELDRSLAAPANGLSADLAAAQMTQARAELAAVRQQLQAMEAEQQVLAQSDRLAGLRRDRAERRLGRAAQEVEELTERVTELRRRAAETQYAKAIRQAEQSHLRVRGAAMENAELAGRREGPEGLLAKIEQADKAQADIASRLEDMQEDYDLVKDRESKLGLTGTLGLMLRNREVHLGDDDDLRKDIGKLQKTIAETQIEIFELSQKRNRLADVEDRVEQAMARVDTTTRPEAERQEIRRQFYQVYTQQKTYLDNVISDLKKYLGHLTQLSIRTEELVALTDEYQNYIAERVLWVRSADLISFDDLSKAGSSLRNLFSLEPLEQLRVALVNDARDNPLLITVLAIGLFVLLAIRPWMRKNLNDMSDRANERSNPVFWPTVAGLGITIALALYWPAFWATVGWRLAESASSTDFARASGKAMLALAPLLLTGTLIRELCAVHGLAEVHFGNSAAAVGRMRRQAWGLMLTVLPLAFIALVGEYQTVNSFGASLGRIAYVGTQLVIAGWAFLMLDPRHGLVHGYLDARDGSWLVTLRWFWLAAAVATPLALAGAAIAGWYETVQHITIRLVGTAWFVISIIVANAILLRWLVVIRRRLTIRELDRRRAAAANATAAAPGEQMPVREPEMRLSEINTQSRSLINGLSMAALLLGLWFVWVDVLPALGILRQVELWHTQVDESVLVETDGGARTEVVSRRVPITLADLLVALIVLALSMAAANNVPGLLEIIILRRLPLDAGGRYAAATLARYTITLVGLLVVTAMLGWQWSQVQWLAAAITVGLGFGLQEIFANFVSGLILLFERPIRVGDTVSVGDVTGTVARIRIRATTISTWDRREFIVPNRELVTGQVMNWTLTDSINRLMIEVGVAYGSDTDRVTELLKEIGRQYALAEPEPRAFFEGFGDSTLNFKMFVFVPALDQMIPTRHAINTAIDKRFREEGIEIAFPQRDVNVRLADVEQVRDVLSQNGKDHGKLILKDGGH